MSQAELKSWDDLYPGRFLKAADLGGKRPVVKIARLYSDDELVSKNDPRGKAVLAFDGKAKELAMNATHRRCLIAMFGADPQAAVGKRIVLCEGRARNPSLNEDGPCVRFWGSPDLARDVKVMIPRMKGAPEVLTMMAVKPPAAPGNRATTAPPAPTGPAVSEVEVLALQARINTTRDPVEVDDLRRELEPVQARMLPEHRAVIRAAFESADERCAGPPT